MSADKALEAVYKQAQKEAVVKLKSFLKKYKAVMDGSYPCPEYWKKTGQEEYWRNGFVNALMREHRVEDTLAQLLNESRGNANKQILQYLQTEYGHGRLEQIKSITKQCGELGLQPSFTVLDEKAVKIAVDDSIAGAPMSQVKVIDTKDDDGAFQRSPINMRRDAKTRQALQRELGISIARGESQRDLIKRINKVFGTEAANAKRIAQTEGTRVRSQAQYQTDQEARQMGIETDRIWHCRHNHSRDGHIMVDGKAADEGGGWWVDTDKGSDYMMYPGDPTASAANVCNCHCYVVSRVRSNSPALQELRLKQDAERQAWNEQEGQSNDWRDRLFGNGNHPYARR